MLCVHVWYAPAKSLPSALKEELHRLRTFLYGVTIFLLVAYVVAFAYMTHHVYEQIVYKDAFSIAVFTLLFLVLITHVVTMLQIKRNILHSFTSVVYIVLASAAIVYTNTLFEASMQEMIITWIGIVAISLVLRYAVSTYRNYI